MRILDSLLFEVFARDGRGRNFLWVRWWIGCLYSLIAKNKIGNKSSLKWVGNKIIDFSGYFINSFGAIGISSFDRLIERKLLFTSYEGILSRGFFNSSMKGTQSIDFSW